MWGSTCNGTDDNGRYVNRINGLLLYEYDGLWWH